MTRSLISVFSHPSNTDPTAVLVCSPTPRSFIYRVRLGFVATYDGKAVDGHFSTEQEARNALAGLSA